MQLWKGEKELWDFDDCVLFLFKPFYIAQKTVFDT